MFYLPLSMRFDADKIRTIYKESNRVKISKVNSEIVLPFYDGSNETVIAIGKYLKTSLQSEIAHAIIHGSIATDEILPYSDFDGLIILKDEIFSDTQSIIHTAKHLNKTFRMMLSFDPHQHHGWIILTENQLKNWPCYFFPTEILNHSKSLRGFNPKLEISFNESPYPKQILDNHCDRILKSLSQSIFPKNIFQLKSLLSEFMLLPSIYVQAKTGKGVFKKFSFEMAASDFDKNEWQVMDEISELRNLWPDFKSNFSLSTNKYFIPQTRYWQIHDNFKLPGTITDKINITMAKSMIKLANQFKSKI